MSRSSLALVPFTFALLTAASGCGGDSGGNPDSGPPPVDQCNNPDDIAIIENLASATDGGIPDGGVPDGGPYPLSYWYALRPVLATCGTESCLNEILTDNGADMCMAQCLESTDAAGLSKGCIDCQSELTRCVTASCINVCLGSDLDACSACTYATCGPRLAECTGLTIPTN